MSKILKIRNFLLSKFFLNKVNKDKPTIKVILDFRELKIIKIGADRYK